MSFDFITTKVYPAILVAFFFGLTIFIHELGHFIMARWRKLVVERFFIGFGPPIFSWKRDGVVYGVAWLPFGGYVALPQMAPMEVVEGKNENVPQNLPPVSALSKILVAVSGPVMNILLALFMACIIWYVGLPVPVNPPVVGWVDKGSVEEQNGMHPGDRIVEINGEPVKTWEDIMEKVVFNREPSVQVKYEREGKTYECLVDPSIDKELGFKSLHLSPVGHPYAEGLMPGHPAALAGVKVGDKFLQVENTRVASSKHLRAMLGQRGGMPTHLTVLREGKEVSLLVTPAYDSVEKAALIGVRLGDDFPYELQRPGPTPGEQFSSVLNKMWMLVSALWHHDKTGIGPKDMSGPVGIVGGFWYEIKSGGFVRGMNLAVLLNINLAILNLLPLPVLDGGHILMSAIEALRRRPLNARFVHATSVTFAVLLFSFILYVTWFDLNRFVFWRFKPAANQTTSSSTESNQP